MCTVHVESELDEMFSWKSPPAWLVAGEVGADDAADTLVIEVMPAPELEAGIEAEA